MTRCVQIFAVGTTLETTQLRTGKRNTGAQALHSSGSPSLTLQFAPSQAPQLPSTRHLPRRMSSYSSSEFSAHSNHHPDRPTRSTRSSRSTRPSRPSHRHQSSGARSARSSRATRSSHHRSPSEARSTRSARHRSPSEARSTRSARHRSPSESRATRSARHRSPSEARATCSARHRSPSEARSTRSARHRSPSEARSTRSARHCSPSEARPTKIYRHCPPSSTQSTLYSSNEQLDYIPDVTKGDQLPPMKMYRSINDIPSIPCYFGTERHSEASLAKGGNGRVRSDIHPSMCGKHKQYQTELAITISTRTEAETNSIYRKLGITYKKHAEAKELELAYDMAQLEIDKGNRENYIDNDGLTASDMEIVNYVEL